MRRTAIDSAAPRAANQGNNVSEGRCSSDELESMEAQLTRGRYRLPPRIDNAGRPRLVAELTNPQCAYRLRSDGGDEESIVGLVSITGDTGEEVVVRFDDPGLADAMGKLLVRFARQFAGAREDGLRRPIDPEPALGGWRFRGNGHYVGDTLSIGLNQSHCCRCGRGADPAADTHDVVVEYSSDAGGPGCGVRWRYVTSDYDGPDVQARVSAMRPDLTWVRTVPDSE
jgi:hypothetical protein